MRIAHLLSHGGLNGVATSLYTLVQAQLRAGHEILLAHPSPSWIEQHPFDKPVSTVISSFPTTVAELSRVGNLVRDWGEDIIHTHGSRANKFGMTYRLVAHTPTVMTAHARLFQIPWSFAHAVIAPSAPSAAYYRKRFLVSGSKMHIVPHMFDIGTVEPVTPASRGSVRAVLGLRSESFVVGSVGEICDRKNQIDMLVMLKRLVDRGVDAELLLIGRIIPLAEQERWDTLLSDPAMAGRIHLLGEREDATGLIHAMDAYICTSRIEEGPIATLEAMASGVPVLTVDVGYSSELIRDNENGRIFAMGTIDGFVEALVALARDPARRSSFGVEARATIADTLAVEKIVPQIDAVYREAIVRSGRRPRKR